MTRIWLISLANIEKGLINQSLNQSKVAIFSSRLDQMEVG